jgi:N4-(beta-N-acetylglucosaminyl)-L-asparaginase
MEKLAAKIGIEPEFRMAAIERVLRPPTGTINCSAINAKGEMSGATTTSGLAWKIAGRAGDSPIIGAGCYCDQDVGAAGATGNGEENIKVVGGHTIVENMRHGMSPEEAGMDALKRIVRNYNGDMRKLAYMDMTYYVLRNDGTYACVTMWEGPPDHRKRFAVIDDKGKRYEKAVNLFPGPSLGWPPMPGGRKLKPEEK